MNAIYRVTIRDGTGVIKGQPLVTATSKKQAAQTVSPSAKPCKGPEGASGEWWKDKLDRLLIVEAER